MLWVQTKEKVWYGSHASSKMILNCDVDGLVKAKTTRGVQLVKKKMLQCSAVETNCSTLG